MIILLLFSILFFSIGSDASNESDLPVYLRGIGWPNVQAELRKDLRLSPFVLPTFYDINLNISVSGYGNATESHFEGTVRINLDISAPIREVELHSLGLTIEQTNIFLSNEINNTLNENEFWINEERESVVLSSSRLIQPGEEITVLIQYAGVARMNGRGFYESWNKRENSHDTPYISLVTQCEPASARTWFPCFDEPDKKAIFQISVNHPEKTTAYSNTRVIFTETEDGIRLTNFESTVPLPAYLIALAITEQPVEKLTVEGYEFRAIGYNRKDAVRSLAWGLKILRNHSIFDGVPFIPEKTDVVVVEDYNSGAMENPGLMMYHINTARHLKTHIHELAHQYFGNLVTLSTWGDIWVNEGFANFYENNLKPKAEFSEWSMRLVSLHENPIHSTSNFINSFYLSNSFRTHSHIHYSKAAQVLRMIRKFVGGEVFDSAIKRYLMENSYANGDATKIINNLVDEYDGDRVQLKKMLHEWIYQPGIAVIFMERDDEGVTLRQSRLHSTFFDEQLRDETTRFTIPLFCTIDGEMRTIVFDSGDKSLTIPLSSNSSFAIENDYGGLFGVWSKPQDVPKEVGKWITLSTSLVRSGMLSVDEFYEAASPFLNDSSVLSLLSKILSQTGNEYYNILESADLYCSSSIKNASLSDLFSLYMQQFNIHVFFCSKEASDRHLMKRFLRDKIIRDEWKIKSDQLVYVLAHIEHLHPGASMEFVMEEFARNPYSIALRANLRLILLVANHMGTLDRSVIEQFVLKYPARAAEVSEEIVLFLEEKYVVQEKRKKNREMIEKFGPDFENSLSLMPEDETITIK